MPRRLEFTVCAPGQVRIHRGQGRATEEVALAVVLQVVRDSPPEQAKNAAVAVFLGDARTPEFDGAVEQFIRQGREIELLGDVEALPHLGHVPGLEPVGADHLPGPNDLDQEVMATRIEAIAVEPRRPGLLEPLAQLEVEHSEAKGLDRPEIPGILGEPQAISTTRSDLAGPLRRMGRIAAEWKGVDPIIGGL